MFFPIRRKFSQPVKENESDDSPVINIYQNYMYSQKSRLTSKEEEVKSPVSIRSILLSKDKLNKIKEEQIDSVNELSFDNYSTYFQKEKLFSSNELLEDIANAIGDNHKSSSKLKLNSPKGNTDNVVFLSLDLKHKKNQFSQLLSNEKKIINTHNNDHITDKNNRKHELKESYTKNILHPDPYLHKADIKNEKNERQKEKIGKLSDKKKIELIKTFSPDKIQTTKKTRTPTNTTNEYYIKDEYKHKEKNIDSQKKLHSFLQPFSKSFDIKGTIKKKDEAETLVFQCNLKREKSINKKALNNRTEILHSQSYKK